MKHRNRNRDGVNLDLTSLLDVIFILLMVVLCSRFNVESEAQNLQKAQEEAVQEANNQKVLYESGVKSAEYAVPVSIVVPFNMDDPTQREIRGHVRIMV